MQNDSVSPRAPPSLRTSLLQWLQQLTKPTHAPARKRCHLLSKLRKARKSKPRYFGPRPFPPQAAEETKIYDARPALIHFGKGFQCFVDCDVFRIAHGRQIGDIFQVRSNILTAPLSCGSRAGSTHQYPPHHLRGDGELSTSWSRRIRYEKLDRGWSHSRLSSSSMMTRSEVATEFPEIWNDLVHCADPDIRHLMYSALADLVLAGPRQQESLEPCVSIL
jgi:hypothetical protein